MRKSTPRPYHHGHLRAELLRQAEKAVKKAGYRELSLREISREVGVSHAASRRHFADKNALLDALACEGFLRLHQKMLEATKDKQEPFDSTLIRIGRAYVSFARENQALMEVMSAMKRDENASDELVSISHQAYVPAIDCFARGQQAGSIVAGEPARLSLVAYSALEGLVSITQVEKFRKIGLDTLVVEVLERIILGLRPRG